MEVNFSNTLDDLAESYAESTVTRFIRQQSPLPDICKSLLKSKNKGNADT
jgi:hypothetical protein